MSNANIEHMLVPMGWSDTNAATGEYAARLAKALGARLTLIHINDVVVSELGLLSGREPYDALDDVRRESERILETRAEPLRELGVDVECVVEVGTAAPEILRYARENDVDLICVARHSRAEPGDRSVLGSLVSKLVRNRDIPTLLVEADPELPREALPVECMFVTSDFSDDAARGLVAAWQLAGALGLDEMVVGHAMKLPVWLRTFGMDDDDATRVETARKKLLEKLQQQVASLIDDGIVRCRVAQASDVPSGVLDMSYDEGAELIVIPSHGRGRVGAAILGSTSSRVVQLSRRPVLVLPPEYLAENVSLES